MSVSIAVVAFPGSNCEHDVAQALSALGASPTILWHQETGLGDADAVVLPGGFAHGDYLRPGAIARFSPIMGALERFADQGGPVVGICNGFQILTEAGLLPGALTRNAGLRFVCRTVPCVVSTTSSVLTSSCRRGEVLRLPVNHGEGRFTCDEATLRALEEGDQVVLRYCEDVNGSLGRIAGVASKAGNVVGLMPHPERASDALLGSTDGQGMLASLIAAAVRHAGARSAGRATTGASSRVAHG